MKYCTACEQSLTINISGATIGFSCPSCGKTAVATPEDLLIEQKLGKMTDTRMLYANLIRNAAEDRVNLQVARDCPECGLDYMAILRLGEEESIVYKCKCGYEVTV